MHGKIDFLSFLGVKMAKSPKHMRSLAPILGDSRCYRQDWAKRSYWPQRGYQVSQFWSPDILDDFWTMHGKIDFLSFFGVKMAKFPKQCAVWHLFWVIPSATGKIGPSTHIGLKEGTK